EVASARRRASCVLSGVGSRRPPSRNMACPTSGHDWGVPGRVGFSWGIAVVVFSALGCGGKSNQSPGDSGMPMAGQPGAGSPAAGSSSVGASAGDGGVVGGSAAAGGVGGTETGGTATGGAAMGGAAMAGAGAGGGATMPMGPHPYRSLQVVVGS